MSNQQILHELIEQVWNQGNFERIPDLVAPAYTIHSDPGDPWARQTFDTKTYQKRVQYSRNIFPDLRFDIQESIPFEDKVVISWYLCGTQLGDMPMIPASGKTVQIPGMTIYSFDHGKACGHWQVLDRMSVLEQLGIVSQDGSK